MRAAILRLAPMVAAFSLATTAHAVPLELGLGIVNPSPDNGDIFGTGLALSQGRALIGAPGDGTTGSLSGRAYLYDTSSGALLRTFENPTPASNDTFGGAVALAGNTGVIGAQNDAAGGSGAGAAYVFDAGTGAVTRTLTNPGPTPIAGDNFGHSVSVSGNRALISANGDDRGATNAGVAYLLDTVTGALLQTFLNPTPASNDLFGDDVALFGNRALVSSINDDTAALNAGAAYLFDALTGALLHTFLNPTPELNNAFGNNDNFGFAVAMSSTRIAIGAPNESVNGFHSGAVYLYDATSFDLLSVLKIPTPNTDTDAFLGNDVALSEDYVLAGAPFRNKGTPLAQQDLGAAFLFDAVSGGFLQEIDDAAPNSNDRFGFTVALDGRAAAIGATGDLVGTIRPGQVFTYGSATPVPLPATLPLLTSGLAVLAFFRRRAAARQWS